MADAVRTRSRDELSRLGEEALARWVTPHLRPEDDGQFIAVDVNTGAYELDEDDYAAVTRLHGRVPGADVYLARVGEPAAYRFGMRATFPAIV